MKKQRKVKDITGWISGRLTVVKLAGRTEYGAKWLCQCSCGNRVAVLATHLKTRSTKSCGCLQRGGKFRNDTKRAVKNGVISRAKRMTLDDAMAKDPSVLLRKFCAEMRGARA